MPLFRWFLCVGVALGAGCGGPPDAAEAPAVTRAASPLEGVFAQAGAEYQVPPALLKSVAYVENRLADPTGASFNGGQGLMNLAQREDWDMVGRASALTGLDRRRLSGDAASNVRGAAAVLRSLAEPSFAADASLRPTEPGAWYHAVSLYAGLVSAELASDYAAEVYAALETGFEVERPDGVVRQAPQFTEWARHAPPGLRRDAAKEYAGAAKWVASPNFTAGRTDYTNIVIHDAEGTYAGTIDWFLRPESKVSSHYVVRSSDGEITQMVEHKNTAWHAQCYNGRSIGIEHEGKAAEPKKWFTPEMYAASAKLTRWIADRHAIPLTRARIIGHAEVPVSCNSNRHSDPGAGWNWTKYMQLVQGTSPSPTAGELTGVIYQGGDASKRVAGATVTVGTQKVTTGTDGVYAFLLPPGGYTVTVTKKGFAPATVRRDLAVQKTVWASVELTPSGATGILKGKIYLFKPATPGDTSTGIAGAVVVAGGQSQVSDATGAYEFQLGPGTYTVKASKADFITRSQARAVVANTTLWGSIALPPVGTTETVPPSVAIDFPLDAAKVDLAHIELKGTASDDAGAVASLTVSLNGGPQLPISVPGVEYSHPLQLAPGENTVVVTAKDAAGKTSTATSRISFAAGVSGEVHPQETPEGRLSGVTLSLKDPTTGAVVASAQSDAAGLFSLEVTRVDADYVLVAKAPGFLTYAETITVPADRQVPVTIGMVAGDDAPPEIGLFLDDSPDGRTVEERAITLYGTARGLELLAISVNGQAGEALPGGRFVATVSLEEGENQLQILGLGVGGESVTSRLTVHRTEKTRGGCAAVGGLELVGLFALAPLARGFRRRRRR